MLDNHKKVQEAACSTLSIVTENARSDMMPFVPNYLSCISLAFRKYQAKNITILYDAITTLVESVGQQLNTPQFIESLMPSLTYQYSQTADDNRDIFQLFECFASVASTLGPEFLPYVPTIWSRCLSIVANKLQEIQMYKQNNNDESNEMEPDIEIIIVTFDLINSMLVCLTESNHGIILSGTPNLYQLLEYALKDDDFDVRQSVLALYGDLATMAYPTLYPSITRVLPLIIEHIEPDCSSAAVSLCSNNHTCYRYIR